MNRIELIAVLAVILFLAFASGWVTSWLYRKFNRVNTSNVADLDHMASALHDAEETRDQALAYMEDRERDLTNQLSQSQAELAAAMEGLGEARREASELRAYIEANSS